MLKCPPIVRLLLAVVVLTGSPAIALGAEPAKALQELLSIGEPGPSAIALKTWIAKYSGDRFYDGEPITIHFQADQDARVMVLGVSSGSDILMIFPNTETPDNFLRARKLYTIFDDQSRLRLKAGKGVPGAKLVFYVCAAPFELPMPRRAPGEAWLSYQEGAGERIKGLRQMLEAASRQRGFNRVELTLDDAQGNPRAVDLKIRAPENGRARKQLPREGGESSPETISGTHGIKQLPGEVSGDGPETTDGAQGVK